VQMTLVGKLPLKISRSVTKLWQNRWGSGPTMVEWRRAFTRTASFECQTIIFSVIFIAWLSFPANWNEKLEIAVARKLFLLTAREFAKWAAKKSADDNFRQLAKQDNNSNEEKIKLSNDLWEEGKLASSDRREPDKLYIDTSIANSRFEESIKYLMIYLHYAYRVRRDCVLCYTLSRGEFERIVGTLK